MKICVTFQISINSSETEEEAEPEIGLEAELRDMQDDVIAPEANASSEVEAVWTTPAMRSEPVNKLFIEQRSKSQHTVYSTYMF